MDNLEQKIEQLEVEKEKLLKEIKFLNHGGRKGIDKLSGNRYSKIAVDEIGDYLDYPNLLKSRYPHYFEEEKKESVTVNKRPTFEEFMGWKK